MRRKTNTIDATGKVLGRLASQIALLLQGKDKAEFAPYKDMGDFVVVQNVDKIKLTGKKLKQKVYYRHSGYLGGLKTIPLKRIFEEKPGEVLRKAVFGMLPKNKLRVRMIKRLKIEDHA